VKRTHILIVVIPALFIALFFLLFEVVEKEVNTGPQGMARMNPYHAVDLYLDEMGIETESRFNLDNLPDTERALILMAADQSFRERLAGDLSQWVRDGGHLILYVVPDDTTIDPILNQIWIYEFDARNERDFFRDNMRDLGTLDTALMPLQTTDLDWLDECWHFNNDGECRVARVQHGQGHVTFFETKVWLRSEMFAESDHAKLLWMMMHVDDTSPQRALMIVRGGAPSLWSMLWTHGWMIIVSFAGWLAVWLWRSGVRVAPLLPSKEPVRQRLLEHVEASGAMLWRLDHHRVLQDSVRDAVGGRHLARLLAHTEGTLPISAPGDEQDPLSAALATDLADPDAFTQTMQQAQRLWMTPHDRSGS